MRMILKAAALCGAAALAQTAQAETQSCAQEHISKTGETIYQIAADASQPGLNRQLLINALSQKHGLSRAPLPTGTIVTIPCVGARAVDLPREYWSATAGQPMKITVETAGYEHAATAAAVGVGSLYDALLGGAMDRGRLDPAYQVLQAESNTAQPFSAGSRPGDLSFPWMKSMCKAGATGGASLCAGMHWSDPLFEVTSSAYAAVTDAAGARAAQREGQLCIAAESRSAVTSAGIFNVAALQDAAIAPAENCLEHLRAGSVAMAFLPDIAVLTDERSRPGARKLSKVNGMTVSDTVHAVVDKRNPNAAKVLRRINDGVARIRTSGVWYRIVRTQLSRGYLN